ncbi:uncharacterized protein LOC119453116 isoform X2 [Dermacentor silvarum]|uniref:uncharacterized protein LOC119453116 isoform X2 n=1 Tax=Dermacentor silvarum TaxID=543639 RepID=UPI0021009925|nr:uncharacterized protein LOC119453116 isoform X2 [Dermacentor silvarum]
MNHRVQRTTTTNTKPAALWVCTEIKEDEETERDSQRAMIAPSQKASTSESLEGLVLAFLRSPFYSDQVKTHSMRRHHLPLSRRQHEGPRRPAADDARRTTSAPSSTSTSTAALPADEDVALAPQGDSERRHRDGVDSCVMGLSADEPSLPLLDPVGKAIGASASLLTATPTVSSRPTSAADSTLPATCGRRRSERRHGWRCLAPLSRCVWAACRGESLGVTLVSALNLSLAVSVVVSCKLSYDRARLPNLSLTVVHLAASLAALRTAAAFKVTWLLSLPVTAWLQTVVFGRRQRRAAVLSLLPVALGVSMNALGDLRFNPAGLFFGVAGAAAAAFYFTLAAEQQRRLRQPPVAAAGVPAPARPAGARAGRPAPGAPVARTPGPAGAPVAPARCGAARGLFAGRLPAHADHAVAAGTHVGAHLPGARPRQDVRHPAGLRRRLRRAPQAGAAGRCLSDPVRCRPVHDVQVTGRAGVVVVSRPRPSLPPRQPAAAGLTVYDRQVTWPVAATRPYRSIE